MKRYGGKLIFEGHDQAGVVEVIDRNNVRSLHFGTATEQSSMFLDRPFAIEMEYVRKMALAVLFKTDWKRALCLGLGGGSLPKFLWKYFPESQVTAVEFSPLVLEIAHRFFEVPDNSRLQIICDEALHFLQNTQEQNDLIFVDLYIGSGIAPVMAEKDFFKLCHDHLQPGGILVWNMWRSASRELLETSLVHLSQAFWRNMVIAPNKESSNFVVIVFKEPIADYSLKEIQDIALKLKEQTALDFPDMLNEINFFKGQGLLFQHWDCP